MVYGDRAARCLPDQVTLFQTAPRPASLLEVFLQRYANLLRFAESLTRDRREAEDLVQDACVRSPRGAARHLRTSRTSTPTSSRRFATSIRRGRDGVSCAPRRICPLSTSTRRTSRSRRSRRPPRCTRATRSGRPAASPARAASPPRPRVCSSSTSSTGMSERRSARSRTFAGSASTPGSRAAAPRSMHTWTIPMRRSSAIGLDSDPRPARRTPAGRVMGTTTWRACARPSSRCAIRAASTRASFVRYADPATPVSTDVLADLVACPRCLDTVNRMTQLPVLADRHPRDAHDDTPMASRRGATRQSPRTAPVPPRRRADRAHHSRPSAARAARAGERLPDRIARPDRRGDASHARPRWTQSLRASSKSTASSACASRRCRSRPCRMPRSRSRPAIALDDGRRLELNVVFDAPWPTLHLAFTQPLDESPAREWNEDAVPSGRPARESD